jgi:lantibiotic modifying enzyme
VVLFRPESHEPLTAEPWDGGRARDAIRSIVADADGAFDPARLWPAHEWEAWNTPLPLTTLYTGAAGVLWGLDALRRRGLAETRIDLAAAAGRTVEAWRAQPDLMRGVELPSTAEAGLLSGESGILVVAWRLTGDDALADDLHRRVRENVANVADEIMWGAPGTLLAARAMLDLTGEPRWADAWRESADAVWSRRDADGLWTHRLYGETYRGLGPPHGVVGNVLALLRGGDLLAPDRRERLERETAALLARTSVLEDGVASWPGAADEEPDGRVQWCTGAPGIVVSAAGYLDEELLLAGAELVWRAGPVGPEKGAGICHGVAAGGYALLRAFERTGDESWLERARRFAVHALRRVERAEGRYALWTGDVGVALYAADCLDARASYPIMDGW